MGGGTGRGRRSGIRLAGLCLLAGLAAAAAATPAGEIEVVASKAGFQPRLLRLRKGETVRLLLRTADGEHCFAVDAFRIEKRIVPGRATVLDLTPDRTGTFPFYCCLDSDREAERGRLVVTE
jgi:plastocyanin